MKSQSKMSLEKLIEALRRDIRDLKKLLRARDPDSSMTIAEFCSAEGMSETQYHRDPHKPDVFYIGEPDAGRKTPRIGPEARRRWRAEREQRAREYQDRTAAE